jgi:hypothetical protein
MILYFPLLLNSGYLLIKRNGTNESETQQKNRGYVTIR